MALKKNSPNISDEMSLLNEVPAFLKRETSPVNPKGGKDWIMFPNDMPLVSQILGSEPIMVQSEEAEEPLTITPNDIRTWLTGTVESGSIGFITGDVLYNELTKYVPKTTKVNGHALTGDITITKGDIGLGNVDNTSDMDKPISNAVNNKFQELEDTWGVDITQLKIDVNNIDKLLDKTVIEVNRLSEIIGELDTDFTDHIVDPNAHSNIRVNSMVDSTTDTKIPNVSAVRDFVTNYVSRLPLFRIPAYNNRYFYILNGVNQERISDTDLKEYFKMSTIYKDIVTSPSQFPDPSTLTSGTIVRVGRFLGEIITDPYTSYSAKEGEILVFNGNTYEHLAYAENVTTLGATSTREKVSVEYSNQTESLSFDLPIVSENNPGILSIADYLNLKSLEGLTKYGTPNSSWQIGYNTGDLIGISKKSGGALDFIWDNPDNPKKTDAEGNNIPYYAAVTLGDLTIKGNVTQEGSSFISKAETVEVKDNTLLLNKGETGAGVTKGTAGVEIDRGTLPRYQFLFDESDDRFKVGSVGDLWPVMIRDEEADLTDGGILTWDATTKRAKTAFNIDDLSDKYLPLTGGTMTGSIMLPKNKIEDLLDPSKQVGLFGIPGWITSGVNPSNMLLGYCDDNILLGNENAYLMIKGKPITLDSGSSINLESKTKIDIIGPSLYLSGNNGNVKISCSYYDIIIAGKRVVDENGNKFWTAGNDGAGSELDADLLDGQHGSYYAKADEYLPLTAGRGKPLTGRLYFGDNLLSMGKETIHFELNDHDMISAQFNGVTMFSMSQFLNLSQAKIVALRGVLSKESITLAKDPSSDGPTVPPSIIFTQSNPYQTYAKIKCDGYLSLTLDTWMQNNSTGGNIYLQTSNIHRKDKITGNKYMVYDQSNLDISKFALKTDLDNIDLSGYLPLSGGTMTGSIILPKNGDESTADTIKGLMGTPGWLTTPSEMGDYILGYSQDTILLGNEQAIITIGGRDISQVSMGDFSFQANGRMVISTNTSLDIGCNGPIKIGAPSVVDANNNKYWTAGNDGTGSGLDADLLDGKQGSEYALASEYLPLSAGESHKLTGALWAPVGIGGGAENFNVNVVAGRSTDDHAGIEVNATGTAVGFGAHKDGNAYFWIGGNGTQDKAYFAKVNKTSKGMNFLYRPMYNGTNLATVSEIPTSLPANGGTSTHATYLKVNDLRASATNPDYGDKEIIGWFNNLGTPNNAWWSGIHVKGWQSDYGAWELAGPSDSVNPPSDALWFRSGRGTTWNGWKRVAFAGELNDYVTLGTTQTITGAKTFSSFTIFPAGSGTSSDIRLKENLILFYDSEEILRGIHGYRYTMKESGKKYAGLVAQEVQKVLPEAVVEGEDGFLSVDTYPIIAALVESNNVKDFKIKTLETRLQDLEQKVNMLLSRV